MKYRLALVAVCSLIGAIAVPPVAGQTPSLTPQQQAMLNQLPPAERQQALAALRQMQQAESAGGQLSSTAEPLSAAGERLPAGIDETFRLPAVPKAKASSRLIVDFAVRDGLSRDAAERYQQDIALQQLEGSQYFELDTDGELVLPGVATIALAGLTNEQIQRRLGAEPALGIFEITVSLLGEPDDAADAVKPFGYDVFESVDYGFEPVTTGPVPPDYVLGPGDSVRVQLFGNVNAIYEYEVSRDGILNLPELGPVTVAGLPFSELRQDIDRRVREMLIGTQVSVTLGQLRTIRVFVLGDANRPGSYVVNSLATISSALYVSGGISPVGTLRDIQLKRNGQLISRLDLYDLLLRGDNSGDRRLQPGDVIFIPPVGTQVTVAGAVKRPAIYETRGRSTVADAIALAGGFQAEAYPDDARIERVGRTGERHVVSLDADSDDARNMAVQPGDMLTIPHVLPQLENTVTLAGHVHRPGPYQWHEGMRLTDLVGSVLALKPGADANYLLIRREDSQTRRVSVKSANLTAALAAPSSGANERLHPRDTVQVFSLAFGRQRVIEPILDELQVQSRLGEPFEEVSISGGVRAPGIYPLEPGMRVSDLIRAGGNLSEEAYTLKAELARYSVEDDEIRVADVIDVDLEAVLRGDTAEDLQLQPHDNLRISVIPQWDALWIVRLEGEVRFPGMYRIRRGETLGQILERAGGLTSAAFPDGAIFLRESLREREQEQIRVLAKRMETDLASIAMEKLDTTGSEAYETGQLLLAQLRETEAVGRLVIDLDQILAGGDRAADVDVELRDGDRLLVPKKAQEVTVIGEAQQSMSHLYEPGLSRDDYIDLSGGLTRRADKKLIYVVRASGAVIAGSGSKWFGRNRNIGVQPGDTVVVPLQTDRIRPLTLWTNVTQILYQAAIALAAIQTFDN